MGDRHYWLGVAPAAMRALAKLAPPDQRRIRRAIDGPESDPRLHGALLLGDAARRLWRLRVGDYRVIYEIRDDVLVVLVIRIGHRPGGLPRALRDDPKWRVPEPHSRPVECVEAAPDGAASVN